MQRIEDRIHQIGRWYHLSYPQSDLRFPENCPKCGQPTDTTAPVMARRLGRYGRLQGWYYVPVPHCTACAGRRRFYNWASWRPVAGPAAIIACGIIFRWHSDESVAL